MDSIVTTSQQLPDTLEDLTKFVLVGKTKLTAYMAKLKTVNRLAAAQEIRNQTLEEAQDIATALIAAEQRIGEILLELPKSVGGRPSENSAPKGEEFKPKGETITEMGYSRKESSDYQTMAKNPEVVQRVIADAMERGEVVTKTQVLREIQKEKEIRKKLEESLQQSKEEVETLKAQTPEVVEKVVEKVVEVVPDDYETVKKKAKEAKAWETDYYKQRDVADARARQVQELQEKLEKAKEETAKEQHEQSITTSAIFYAAECAKFLESVGGYVWIADHLKELPERERRGYVVATEQVSAWAQALLQNMEDRKELPNG